MLKDSLLKFFKIDGFIENLSGYIETRAELFKHEIKEEITKSLAKFSMIFVLVFFFIVSIIFMSVALALWLGSIIGNITGFALIGGLYLLIGVILLRYQKPISRLIEEKLMKLSKHKK